MKRIILFLLAIVSYTGLQAQDDVETGEYEARFHIKIRDGADNHSGRCTNKFEVFTTLTGESEQNMWYVDLNPIGTDWREDIEDKVFTIPVTQQLWRFRVRGERNWRNCCGCNGDDGWTNYEYPFYSTCFERTYYSHVPEWTSELTLKIYPRAINLYYFDRSGAKVTDQSLFYLPQAHKVQIKATKGFPSFTYQWQYQVGDGEWKYFPSNLYNSNTLTFAGNDIPDIDFVRDVVLQGKSVKVRISYGCNGYSSVIALRPLLSAPDMVGTPQGIPPTCSYLNDGKLVVTFNRALYDGETISFAMDGFSGGLPQNVSQLDPGNTFTIEGQSPFNNRVLTFIGHYAGHDTYTDDPVTQSKTVSVPVRPPITFTADAYAVHCFEGEDGRITVTAAGGTESYTAFLLQGITELKQITLTSTTANSFTGLKKGEYEIKIKDSHQCDPPSGSAPVFRQVDQPVQKVLLSTVENIEPLGYGLTNGHITVRAQSGTHPYTFDWSDKRTGTGLAGDPPTDEGSSMTSTLSNIGKGTYYVVARDVNYALADPQIEANLRGCYDTLTIVMGEPPLLEVTLEEHRFVSCHGYTDGEVVAHAKGGRPYTSGHTYHPYQYEWFVVEDGGALIPFGESDSIALQRPSAFYRIKVTDRNGIIAWSENFFLEHPNPLVVNFNTSQLLCNGDTNGRSEALPAGGTWPYRYSWSNDATTSYVENLTDGWYSVVVVDTRGCTTYAKTEVTVPNSLDALAEIVPPTCYGYTDGTIRLNTSGGRPPYRYEWQHGEQNNFIRNLAQGEYHVRITDANNCFIQRDYTVAHPDQLTADLGPDRVLCKGQTLILDATIDDPAAQYSWTKDGAPFGTGASAELIDPGRYRVVVRDSKGCNNTDEVAIQRDDTEISASIAVATRVPQNGRFRVANISHPAPDRVEWIIPEEANVLDQTPDYLDLSFNAIGEYRIGLKSFRADCESVTHEPVRVVNKNELKDYETPDEPYIKQFGVTPNPNDGNFKVTVELREEADFVLILYTGQGNVQMQKEIKGRSYAQVDFEVSASKGLYVLQLVTRHGQSIFKVVID